MSKKKAAKPKTPSTKQGLQRTVSDLRRELRQSETKLTKARAKAERWKVEATSQRKTAARAGTRAEKLQRKLARAKAAKQPVPASGSLDSADSTTTPEPTTGDAAAVPDETWTVAELRAEARARGLSGMSNKPKAQLIAALS